MDNDQLQLQPIQLTESYIAQWNVYCEDFVVLTKNGKQISNTLYRVGGLGMNTSGDFFMLLKYEEIVCDLDFIKDCYPEKSDEEHELLRKNLVSRYCILDKNGIEKKVFDRFRNPHLIDGSCIYSIDGNYYNVITDEFYCHSTSSMESSEYLFLDNKYDKDPTKRGVMKINKKDGSWTIFTI